MLSPPRQHRPAALHSCTCHHAIACMVCNLATLACAHKNGTEQRVPSCVHAFVPWLRPHACSVFPSLHFATKAWLLEKTVSTPPHAARLEFRPLGSSPPAAPHQSISPTPAPNPTCSTAAGHANLPSLLLTLKRHSAKRAQLRACTCALVQRSNRSIRANACAAWHTCACLCACAILQRQGMRELFFALKRAGGQPQGAHISSGPMREVCCHLCTLPRRHVDSKRQCRRRRMLQASSSGRSAVLHQLPHATHITPCMHACNSALPRAAGYANPTFLGVQDRQLHHHSTNSPYARACFHRPSSLPASC